MIYTFGTYRLDTQTCELCCGDALCKLEPRVFAVLMYLVENRDHVVSRDELVDNLWPGQVISEAVLNNCIMTARKVLRDSGEDQQTIRTHYGGCDQRSLVTLIPQLELVAALDAIAKTRPTSGSLVRPAGLTWG